MAIDLRRLSWPALTALLLGLSALVHGAVAAGLPSAWLDWQPELALRQPWRWWTAAVLHWSDRHLLMNAVGLGLMAWLAWRAEADLRATAAWAVAWPLTQLGLLVQPSLQHYAGLSGVGHAGAAVLVAVLWRHGGPGLGRWPALLLGGGLLVKILHEQPWAGPVQTIAGWDFALAPASHACGALAGGLSALLLGVWRTREH